MVKASLLDKRCRETAAKIQNYESNMFKSIVTGDKLAYMTVNSAKDKIT